MGFDRSLLWPSQATTRRGPKPKMTLDGIVDAAIRIADAEGLAAVSMQHIADDLGVTKMSIYRYVPGKAELTALMLDKGVGAPPESLEADAGWRAGLTGWSIAIHRRFAEAPWALELAVGARVVGPNELAWFERGLATLARTPLTGAEKLDVLALLSGHVRGVVQQQSANDEPERTMATLMSQIIEEQTERFPEVAAAFGDTAATGGQDQALGFGIDRILDGVQALIASRS